MESVRPYPESVAYSAAVFSIIFSIIGVFGNVLTIIAFLKSSKIQKNLTTKFIINLAISDLIISAVSLPILAGQFLYDSWLLDKTLCQISSVILYGNINVSLLTMTAIALNRYVTVVKPKFHPIIFTNLKVNIMFIAIWTISYLERLPPTMEIWGKIDIDPKTKICGSCKAEGDVDGLDPKLVLSIIAFVIPCVVMGFSYLCIYLELRKVRNKLYVHASIRSRHREQKDDSDEREVTKLMFILFVSFLICFLPMILIVVIIDPDSNYPSLHVASTLLNCAVAFINPFIYAGTNKLYREAYKQILVRNKEIITKLSGIHRNSENN